MPLSVYEPPPGSGGCSSAEFLPVLEPCLGVWPQTAILSILHLAKRRDRTELVPIPPGTAITPHIGRYVRYHWLLSDTFLRIIAVNPEFVPSAQCELKTVGLLKALVPDSNVVATRSDEVQFVDPGENFERVLCPNCVRTWLAHGRLQWTVRGQQGSQTSRSKRHAAAAQPT